MNVMKPALPQHTLQQHCVIRQENRSDVYRILGQKKYAMVGVFLTALAGLHIIVRATIEKG